MPITFHDQLRDIILRNISITLNCEIGPETDLIQDLALNSIAIANLLADVEEEFAIVIDVEEVTLATLTRFESLADFVEKKASV